jgi:hypothetical protein
MGCGGSDDNEGDIGSQAAAEAWCMAIRQGQKVKKGEKSPQKAG